MPLADIEIRNAKPRAKACKLADGEGMYLGGPGRRQVVAP